MPSSRHRLRRFVIVLVTAALLAVVGIGSWNAVEPVPRALAQHDRPARTTEARAMSAWQRAVEQAADRPPTADEAGITAGEVPWTGSGEMVTVPGSEPAPDTSGRVVTVLVRVESDLPIDGATFAAYALATLNDSRGWGASDNVSFARTDDPAQADVTLNLASPATTDVFCASLGTNGYVSCGLTTSVNLNANRWVNGAYAFTQAGGSLEEYHRYLVNHEFGHYLGHAHTTCPAVGSTAPVMLQQTLDLDGCVPNGWPNP